MWCSRVWWSVWPVCSSSAPSPCSPTSVLVSCLSPSSSAFITNCWSCCAGTPESIPSSESVDVYLCVFLQPESRMLLCRRRWVHNPSWLFVFSFSRSYLDHDSSLTDKETVMVVEEVVLLIAFAWTEIKRLIFIESMIDSIKVRVARVCTLTQWASPHLIRCCCHDYFLRSFSSLCSCTCCPMLESRRADWLWW